MPCPQPIGWPGACAPRQEAHIARLRRNLDTGGDASLQNALDVAVDALKSIPPYGHRRAGQGGRAWRRSRAARADGCCGPSGFKMHLGVRASWCAMRPVATPASARAHAQARHRSPAAAARTSARKGVGRHASCALPGSPPLARPARPPGLCREVLFMLAALSTCDPGDIAASIKAAKQHRVRVSGALGLQPGRVGMAARHAPAAPAGTPVLGPLQPPCVLPGQRPPATSAACAAAEGGGSRGLRGPAAGYAANPDRVRGAPLYCTPPLPPHPIPPPCCAVVGLAAEMYVCRRMTQQTGGTYSGGRDREPARAP